MIGLPEHYSHNIAESLLCIQAIAMGTDAPMGTEPLYLKSEESPNQSVSQELSDLRSQIGKLFVKRTPSHCLSLVQRPSVYLDLLSPRGQYYALCKLPTVQQIILTRDPA